MKRYKYREYERKADVLLDYMALKDKIKESEVGLYMNALAILEYDGFARWWYDGNEKVYFLTDRGEIAWKNGGYRELVKYLNWNNKEEILTFSVMPLSIAIFVFLYLREWLAALMFVVILVALFMFYVKARKKYDKWIYSNYKWGLDVDY